MKHPTLLAAMLLLALLVTACGSATPYLNPACRL